MDSFDATKADSVTDSVTAEFTKNVTLKNIDIHKFGTQSTTTPGGLGIE